MNENLEVKKHAMLQFGMNPSANRIQFYFLSLYHGNLAYVFNRSLRKEFADDVVEFLANVSLTHTITCVDFYNDERQFDVWLRPSSDTNIDWELIDCVARNIKNGRII